jgi:hypothetical protein
LGAEEGQKQKGRELGKLGELASLLMKRARARESERGEKRREEKRRFV